MGLSFMYATQVLQYFSLQVENCLIFVSITYLAVHNVSSKKIIFDNGIRSAARGRVDRCPARAAAAVSAADPTFRPEYSAH